MRGKSPTLDEPDHLQFGQDLLTSSTLEASTQKMPVTALNAAPVVFLEGRGWTPSPRERIQAARLVTVILSLCLGCLIFLWSKSLYGWSRGLLSLTLYVFGPNLLAHARLVTNDLGCSLFIVASLLTFVRYLKAPSPGRLLICALLTGLAQACKQTSLLLFPVFGLLLVFRAYRRAGRKLPVAGRSPRWRRARGLLATVFFFLVVGLALNLAYGFRGTMSPVQSYLDRFEAKGEAIVSEPGMQRLASRVRPFSPLPVPLPRAYVESLAFGYYFNLTGRGHGPNYLMGRLDQEGWWYYFLVALALKLPLGFLALLLIGLVWLRADYRDHPLDTVAIGTMIGAVLLFFSTFCTAQIGVRYVLPVVPLLCIFAGNVARYRPQRGIVLYRLAIATALAWHAISTVSYHPHYLSYANESIGDRKNLYRYLADSNVEWGQNRYLLREHLRRHGGETIFVNPRRPVRGRVIVDVNSLTGVTGDPRTYAWLRDGHEPIDHLGYSWLIYQVPGERQVPRQQTR